ncbi:MAG: hypothetical protein HKN16_03665, partial [Saprospiraceae bacterium]|nr:hypothetical protein [Saprospiraceae bacterium]
MKRFAALLDNLFQTRKTDLHLEYLQQYFSSIEEKDRDWALYFLSGKNLPRSRASKQILAWMEEIVSFPAWLVEKSNDMVGDRMETFILLMPNPDSVSNITLDDFCKELIGKRKDHDLVFKSWLNSLWDQFSGREILVLNRIVAGTLKSPVSLITLSEVISKVYDEDYFVTYLGLHDWNWAQNKISFLELVESKKKLRPEPFPSMPVRPLKNEPTDLGEPGNWQIEQKWDGIRVQWVYRDGVNFLWSREKQFLNPHFPEFTIPEGSQDLVLDGELMALENGRPLSREVLLKRLKKSKISRKELDASNFVFVAFDILEDAGKDLRKQKLEKRREILERRVAELPKSARIVLSEILSFDQWSQATEIRKGSREKFSEGIILKRRDSKYSDKRQKKDWYKWESEELSIKAVLLYAQVDPKRRANLYSFYTFAVWKGEELVPVAKTGTGLSDHSIMEISLFV